MPCLSLLSFFPSPLLTGQTTGLVIDSGHEVTSIVPVVDGQVLTSRASQFPLAGAQITEQLTKLLNANFEKFSFKTWAELDLVRSFKEEYGYCSTDLASELKTKKALTEIVATSSSSSSSASEKATSYGWPSSYYNYNNTNKNNGYFELPDGRVLNPGSELFQCSEILFDPSLFGLSASGLHQQVVNTVNNCEVDSDVVRFVFSCCLLPFSRWSCVSCFLLLSRYLLLFSFRSSDVQEHYSVWR
jgi:actin